MKLRIGIPTRSSLIFLASGTAKRDGVKVSETSTWRALFVGCRQKANEEERKKGNDFLQPRHTFFSGPPGDWPFPDVSRTLEREMHEGAKLYLVFLLGISMDKAKMPSKDGIDKSEKFAGAGVGGRDVWTRDLASRSKEAWERNLHFLIP